MSYDAKLPASLKRTQEWFSSIISREISTESEMKSISPSGRSMEIEAAEYIRPSATLQPHQRMQIYNQQIWWRFLSSLQESFPLVVRFFGYYDFNQMVSIPYLLKYPSNHWSLGQLGNRLVKWSVEDYHEDDKEFVRDAIHLDWAYACSFTAPHYPAVKDGDNPLEIMKKNLSLQPHLFLFEFDSDLFDCRTKFLEEEPEYWIDHDFPELLCEQERYCFVLFRTQKNEIVYQSVTHCEYLLLEQFREGSTIDHACEWLEKQGEDLQLQAEGQLHIWLKKWILNEWLAIDSFAQKCQTPSLQE